MVNPKLTALADDAVRRHAPPKPTRGFLGYQVAGGPYLLQDTTDARYVHGRSEDGNYVKALITAGLDVAKDVAVVFKQERGSTYAYPDTRKDAETGLAAQRAIAARSEPIPGWRLEPGVVGFEDGTLRLLPTPLRYVNWRGDYCQSLASPLDISAAVSALSDGEYAWVISGVDERTNDSAYHVTAPFEDTPDVLQAVNFAATLRLFQFQYATLVWNGQATLTFSFATWADMRPWGQTPTRRRDNLSATTDPGTDDDITQGYDVFSFWLNVSSGDVFQCVDSTEGAASWALPGGTGGASDAGDVTYTPNDAGDWPEGEPANVADALDVLAARESGSTGTVESVTAEDPLEVDATDPANPIVKHKTGSATPGTYTNATVTVDAFGLVTAIEEGDAPVSGGQYRQYVYAIIEGEPQFLKDMNGYPITALFNLE